MLPLVNESSLYMMYYLAESDENYQGQICVEVEKIQSSTNTSFVQVLYNCEVPFALPSDDRFEENNEFSFDEPNTECSSELLSSICDDSEYANDNSVVKFMNNVGNIGDDDIVDEEDNIIQIFGMSQKLKLGQECNLKLSYK